MYNARAVRRCQTCRNLRRNIDRLARGQRPLFNKRPQRFARHQFGDDVRRMLVEPDVVDRHDVGMVQRRRQARLLFETPPPLGILRPRFLQHFERDLPPHAGVQGFVDFPHSARAQLPQDLIRPDRPFRHLSSVNPRPWRYPSILSPHISSTSIASRQLCATELVESPITSSIGLSTSGPLKLVVAYRPARARFGPPITPLQAFCAYAGFFVKVYR